MNPKTKEDFDLLYHTLESEFFDSCECVDQASLILPALLHLDLVLTLLTL